MIIAAVISVAIMQLTTPATIHPIGLLVFFVCLYVVVLGVLTHVIYIGHQLMRRYLRKHRPEMTLLRSYQFASVIALAPVMLIAMRTVGSVTVLDVVFIALFTTMAVFYVARRG